DDEGDDLQPEAALVDHADRARDVVECPAEGSVSAIVEAFEIDLVGDDPGTQVIEDLRRGVAVGNEGASETGTPGFAKDANGRFGGDERLVVAGDDETGALPACNFGQLCGRDRAQRSDRVGIA